MARARAHLRWQGLSLTVIDLACLFVGGLIGAFTRFGSDEMPDFVFNHIDGFVVFCSSVIIANYLAGNYRVQSTFSRFNLVVSWLFSILFAVLILSVTSYAWLEVLIGRGVLFLCIGWYSVLSLLFRQILYKRIFRSSMFVCRVAIVGDPSKVSAFKELLEAEWTLPAHRVVACIQMVEKELHQGSQLIAAVPIIQTTLDNFEDVMRGLDVSLIVLAEEDPESSRILYPRLRRLRFEGFEVMNELVACESYAGRTPLRFLTEDSLMEATLESGLPMVGRFKRLMDIIIAGLGLVVCLPLMLLVAVAIKLSHFSAPVLYTQRRVGQFSKAFRIIKFRTMKPNAEDESGAVWAQANDPRITKLGKLLRVSRLDELPQLVNILWGQMSIVGPRPERPEIVAELEREIPFYSERSNVVPGLTGWAQIRYRYGSSVEDARRKLELDLYYMKHMSLRLDIQIILSTVRIMVFGKERSM
jgi:exopolysaccharide biosynthesis polyprenyl glycosylphosphotransferase